MPFTKSPLWLFVSCKAITPHAVEQPTIFNMISFILRSTEAGVIVHIISEPDNGHFRGQMKTQRIAFKLNWFKSGLYFTSQSLLVHLFLSLNVFSQDFLQGILRQNRFKYFALHFQRDGILYNQLVSIAKTSRGLMHLLCTSKQYLICDLLRLHVASIQPIYAILA